MTRTITEGRIYGWRPGNHEGDIASADYRFEGPDIETVELSERVGELKDTAQVTIRNTDGKYTDSDSFGIVQHGDRVEFHTNYHGANLAYGAGAYGVGPYQPTTQVQWTGIIRNLEVAAEGGNIMSVDFDAEDYPYALMSMRRVVNHWENQRIISNDGSNDGIINRILNNHCPEIDQSHFPDLSTTTTIRLPDKNVLEAVIELANRADLIMYGDGISLRFERPSTISTEFTAEHSDYMLWSYTSNDDTVFNSVRVEGGSSHVMDSDASQEVHDETSYIGPEYTGGHRTVQIETRKNQVARVEVYTVPDYEIPGSPGVAEENVTVRIQKNDGGQPVDINDRQSDIARRTLDNEFIAEDGWTTFIMPSHDLPDPDPWLIFETGGLIGVGCGQNSETGEIAYRTHFPYPVRTRREDAQSQDNYRLRQDTLTVEDTDDLSEARELGDAYLSTNQSPRLEFQFDADSERFHELETGDVIRVDMESVDVSGRFVVVERDLQWSGSLETVELALEDLSTLPST